MASFGPNSGVAPSTPSSVTVFKLSRRFVLAAVYPEYHAVIWLLSVAQGYLGIFLYFPQMQHIAITKLID